MDGTAQPDPDAESFEFDFLSELLGALNEAPEGDQGKILKSFLLSGIDTMREHALFQLDLLEKLGFLAVNNVQDVRLHSLEARVRELEQGKPVTFGQIAGELFFALAIEAAILAGVTVAAPAVAGAGALLIASIKTSARSKFFTSRVSVAGRAATVVDQRRFELGMWETRLLQRLHMRNPAKSNKRAWRARQKLNAVTKQELAAVRQSIEYLDNQREFRMELVGARMVPEDALAARYQSYKQSLYSGKIKRLIELRAHHVDAGKSGVRAFSLLALKDYPDAFTESTGEVEKLVDGFTTTRAALDLTRECESLKLDVILHYGQQRAILDAVAEADIFDAFETVLVLEDIETNLFDAIDLSERMLASLDDFVIPMELAVWLIYLQSNGILERGETPGRRTISQGGYSAPDTRFIGNDVVARLVSSTPIFTDSPRTTYDGLRYAGLGALDEHQAYYLFHKFAKPAVARIADKLPKSATAEPGDFILKDIEAGAFDNVLAMQKVFFLTGENKQRSDLVREMGVVVIEYFRHVLERVGRRKTFGFSESIPEGTAIATLLGQIEAPTLSDLPPDEPPGFTPDEWRAGQEADLLLQWEATTLSRLTLLENAHTAALARYQYHGAMRAMYLEVTPEGFFDDVILGPATLDLNSASAAILAEIGAIRADERHRSEAVDERADILEIKATRAPAERVEPTLFSR